MKGFPAVLPWATAAVCVLATACSQGEALKPYEWDLPAHFPVPGVPDDNPMSDEKVELGRYLFYDTRLSIDGQTSCATCHDPALAFTDGRARSRGATGELTPRSAMSLANVAYNARHTWANPLVHRLEDQALLPMFGESPVEMGLSGRESAMLENLSRHPRYAALFAAAWPSDSHPVTLAHVTDALASFERTLISGSSPYDRYLQGDQEALTPAAERGMTLFFSERLECFHCHSGFNFTDTVTHEGTPFVEVAYHNTGLYNIDGRGAYPDGNPGLFEITGDPADMGRFRAPTLRNISVTAPYMHDGSIETLQEVISHYSQGGRTIDEGPLAGVGADSPLKSALVPGFVLTDAENDDLVAFLESLTDHTFLTDPRFGDPFSAR